MKKLIAIFIMTLGIFSAVDAQEKTMKDDKMMDTEATVISLEQTEGMFTQKELTLKEGTYIFKIANKNVDHEVGFVLAPKDNPEAHIKSAYVTNPVVMGKDETSKEVTLTKGKYIYYCPLNPTPHYTLTVK